MLCPPSFYLATANPLDRALLTVADEFRTYDLSHFGRVWLISPVADLPVQVRKRRLLSVDDDLVSILDFFEEGLDGRSIRRSSVDDELHASKM
jgi:hypothetical protein